jgi:hypothetical protein
MEAIKNTNIKSSLKVTSQKIKYFKAKKKIILDFQEKSKDISIPDFGKLDFEFQMTNKIFQ